MTRFSRIIALALAVVSVAIPASSAIWISRRDGYTPPSWGPSLVGWWRGEKYDNGSGSLTTLKDDADNGDNTLTGTNTPTWDTSAYKEGSASAGFAKASNEYFSCSEANCPDFDSSGIQGPNDSLTWGMFGKRSAGVATFLISKGLDATGATGFSLHRTIAPKIECMVAGSTKTAAANDDNTNAVWTHDVCVFDNTADTLSLFKNGAIDGTAATATGGIATNADDFLINSSDSSNDWDGNADDIFVDDCAWTATDVCRACSLGIDGQLGECDSTTPSNYKACTTNADCNGGRGICADAVSEDSCADANDKCCMGYNVSLCGDCDLPPCDQASPCSTPTYPLDWGGSFLANWRGEDGTATPLTDSATVNGTQPLTGTGAPAITTATVAEGGKHYTFNPATDYYSSNSNVLRPTGGALSYGCFGKPPGSAVAWTMMSALQSGSVGYVLNRIVTSRVVRCQVGAGQASSVATMGDSTWTHAACVHSGTAVQTYVNGAASGSSAAATLSRPTGSMYLNRTNAGANGQISDMDDCFLIAKALTAEQVCRICSLGVSGTYGECDPAQDGVDGTGGANAVSYKQCGTNADCNSGNGICSTGLTPNRCIGRNASLCGSCDLPACRAAAP